ncbi:histidine kinase [Actinomycetaceae bacterium L2_0104]
MSREKGIGPLLAQSGAVALMLVVGFIILFLAPLSSRSNFTAPGELSDLGALRIFLGLLILATIPWYRRRPLVLMGAGAVGALIVQQDPYVLSVGLTVWMVRARQRWQWVIAGVGLAAILANGVIHLWKIQQWNDAEYVQVGTLLQALLSLAAMAIPCITATVVRLRRQNRYTATQVQRSQRQTARLSDELTRQAEREDLAREVHDTLASRLSTIAMQSGLLEDAGSPDAESMAHSIRSNASRAMTDLRDLLQSLRRENEEPEPTVSASSRSDQRDLLDLIQDAEAAGLRVHPCLLFVDSYSNASDRLKKTVFRITQEGLTNALRHSSDQRVSLQIEGSPEHGIRLTMRNSCDPESGFTSGAAKGLIGVKERVRLLHGTLATERTPEQFILNVELPWEFTAEQR